jgi:hypothetical protein
MSDDEFCKFEKSNIPQIVSDARLERFDGVFLFPQNDTEGKGAAKTVDYRHLKNSKQ